MNICAGSQQFADTVMETVYFLVKNINKLKLRQTAVFVIFSNHKDSNSKNNRVSNSAEGQRAHTPKGDKRI